MKDQIGNKKYERCLPLISVLMAVRNGDRTLSRATRSILNQTYTKFEFVIVDDGSTDQTWTILKTFSDLRIKLLRNPEPRGLAFSLNRAFSAAKGDYLARMDADDEALPLRFELQIKHMENNPHIDILGSSAFIQDSRGNILGIRHVATDEIVLKQRIFHQSPFIHPTVMMRWKVLKKLDGYDSSLLKAEDYDLWLRARKRFRFSNIEKPLLIYTEKEKRVSLRRLLIERTSVFIAIRRCVKQECLSSSLYALWIVKTLKSISSWLLGRTEISKLKKNRGR